MRAVPGTSLGSSSWFEAPIAPRISVRPRVPNGGQEGRTSLRAIIVSSFFLALFAVTLMVGGHAAIDPLLRAAMEAREARGVGNIIYPMPDGKFCRHLSFDNATAEVLEGKIEPCPENMTQREFRHPRGFSWGTNSDQ